MIKNNRFTVFVSKIFDHNLNVKCRVTSEVHHLKFILRIKHPHNGFVYRLGRAGRILIFEKISSLHIWKEDQKDYIRYGPKMAH